MARSDSQSRQALYWRVCRERWNIRASKLCTMTFTDVKTQPLRLKSERKCGDCWDNTCHICDEVVYRRAIDKTIQTFADRSRRRWWWKSIGIFPNNKPVHPRCSSRRRKRVRSLVSTRFSIIKLVSPNNEVDHLMQPLCDMPHCAIFLSQVVPLIASHLLNILLAQWASQGQQQSLWHIWCIQTGLDRIKLSYNYKNPGQFVILMTVSRNNLPYTAIWTCQKQSKINPYIKDGSTNECWTSAGLLVQHHKQSRSDSRMNTRAQHLRLNFKWNVGSAGKWEG